MEREFAVAGSLGAKAAESVRERKSHALRGRSLSDFASDMARLKPCPDGYHMFLTQALQPQVARLLRALWSNVQGDVFAVVS